MSTNLPEPQPSEEVDLGQLFKLIGNAFDRLFKFIRRIFGGIFHVLILFLIFVKQHIIKFAIAGVIGVGIGFYLDSNKEQAYMSSMVVEPNFNSVQQLYNNIEFYNELAKAKDSSSLGTALGIEPKEAISIKEIFVDSYTDENQKIKLFDAFLRELDTTTQKNINMEAYLKDFNSMDARFHRISVVSSSNIIAKKIQDKIIEGIVENEYFEMQRQTKTENLKFQDTIYQKQLTELDSLQLLYKKVMLKEADKPMQGTSISMADTGTGQNKEMAIINERNSVKNAIVALNVERVNKTNVVNVISNFPERGARIKGIFKSYKFQLPAVLILFVFAFYALFGLSKFLERYNK